MVETFFQRNIFKQQKSQFVSSSITVQVRKQKKSITIIICSLFTISFCWNSYEKKNLFRGCTSWLFFDGKKIFHLNVTQVYEKFLTIQILNRNNFFLWFYTIQQKECQTSFLLIFTFLNNIFQEYLLKCNVQFFVILQNFCVM